MRRTLGAIAAVGTLLVLPSAADAQVQRNCKSVTAGRWSATSVSAFNMGCRSARAKLRRWLGRGRLPHNRDGWHCGLSGVPGKNRQCITFATKTGDPVGFNFLLRRRR